MSKPSLKRLWEARRLYPVQFWLILGGLLISTIGTSMIFPFLTIYVSEQLDLPLAEVASLITLNGFVALVASFSAGPVTDRLGRKSIMAASLLGSGLTYFMFARAHTFLAFAVLMALRGLFHPAYKVATDAMVSDLIPPHQRPDAYALMRMSDNVGVAIGPAIGGFLVVSSYGTSFAVAASTLTLFGILIALFAHETVPEAVETPAGPAGPTGYGRVVRDRPFMAFVFAFTLFKISSVMLWALAGVYTKQNYGLLESQYGLIPMTNALIVVLFQVTVTKITKRFLPLPVMAVGTFIYAVAVGSMALGQGFWGFWMSFVIMTVGELIIMPTSSTFVANVAPVDMRGRYMGFFSLSQGLGRGVAPLLGGLLNDNIGPKAIWVGGGLIGAAGSACYAALARAYSPRLAERRARKEATVS